MAFKLTNSDGAQQMTCNGAESPLERLELQGAGGKKSTPLPRVKQQTAISNSH